MELVLFQYYISWANSLVFLLIFYFPFLCIFVLLWRFPWLRSHSKLYWVFLFVFISSKISNESFLCPRCYVFQIAFFSCFMNALHSFHWLSTFNMNIKKFLPLFLVVYFLQVFWLYLFLWYLFFILPSFCQFLMIVGSLFPFKCKAQSSDRKL